MLFKCIYRKFFFQALFSDLHWIPNFKASLGTRSLSKRQTEPLSSQMWWLTQHCDIQFAESTCSPSVMNMQSLLHKNQMAKTGENHGPMAENHSLMSEAQVDWLHPTPPPLHSHTHTLKLAGTFDISFNWRLKLPQVCDKPIWCCFLQCSLCQGLLSHLFKPTMQFCTTNERSFLFYDHSSSVKKSELS